MTTEISSLSSSSSYSGISGSSHKKSNIIEQYQEAQSAQSGSVSVGMGVDKLANFTKAVSKMTTDEKKELNDLLDSVKDELKKGKVNVEEIVSKASDKLKKVLASKDVDLADTINDIAEDYKKGKNQQSLGSNGQKAGKLMDFLTEFVDGSIAKDTADVIDALA